MVHEDYGISMMSDMPDRDTFYLSLEFLDPEAKKHNVTDNSSINLYFPPRYKPTTAPYVSQSTNLTEQMAGTKRSHKDEDAYIPAGKLRISRGGRSGKNDSSGKLH
jgi:hypothetical protein